MRFFKAALPWIVLSLGLIYVAWLLFPLSGPDPNDFDYAGFGAIPVLHNGRIKPMDTVARSYLTLLTHKQTFVEEIETSKIDENGKPIIIEKRQPAIRWLLDVMVALPPIGKEEGFSGPATKHKVFRIENDEVLSLIGIPERLGRREGDPLGRRYSIDEIKPGIKKLVVQAARADKIRKEDPKKLTLYDAKVLELAQHINTFKQLASYEIPQGIPMGGRPYEKWRSLEDAINAGIGFLESDPGSMAFVKMLFAYNANDPKTFNRELGNLQSFLKKEFPTEASGVSYELTFNRFEPFHQATVLYIFAILLGSLSWLGWSQPLGRAAFWLTVLAFVIHSWAILARMQILARPPVINLYSSAVFIGWCCVGVCLLMELVYRNCIPLVAGTVLAAVTGGVIGHYLSLDGDTLEMLQAVLDTNLWLATHVTTVTFGYGATLFAGILGIFYILLEAPTAARTFCVTVLTFLTGIFFGLVAAVFIAVFGAAFVLMGYQGLLKKDASNHLVKMIYGVVCFATLLSFTGTVLGGIWADQSWGRFWGWDPKENGALLIVIWNALILHARWGGIIKQRGMALLTIAGNVVVSWSYFGTNLLGVGLHAYGFKSGTRDALIFFALSQLTLIVTGLISQIAWLRFPTPYAFERIKA